MKRIEPRRRARHRVGSALLLVAGLPLASCGVPGTGPPADSPRLPPGFALRLDRPNRDAAEFVVTEEGGRLLVRTGPAGIVYRPDQVVDSDRFTVRARFTEIDAPVGHQEAFGLFIGGRDLQGPGQQYVYFLVRGDGRYLVKQRDAESTREQTDGWRPSEAVRAAATTNAEVSNDLAVMVEGDRVRFSCNGTTVSELPLTGLTAKGVVGLRVNHNLHVRIEDFRVDEAPAESSR
jgi:hypothetical protein